MRAPTLETNEDFEGVGAHELNSRFDWIPEEHGDDTDSTQFDPPNAGIIVDPVQTPALARAQSLLTAAGVGTSGRLDGGDTSHYQFTQGGGVMKIGPGLWWWMHKASQSTSYRDPTLAQALVEMAKAGVDIPGTYHWGSSTTDPQKQAANWLAAVGPTYQKRLVFMGDMEEGGLTVETVLGIYEAVEAVTKKPCSHYTGLYVSGGALYRDARIRTSKYGPRPIIVAAYVTRARLNSLVQSQGQGHPWHAWQFSSDGPVPNVVGRCDMDEVADRNAFLLSLNGSVTQPQPTEDEVTYLYQDDRFANVFLVNGDAVAVGGALFAQAQADGVKWVRDVHDPSLISMMRAAGLTMDQMGVNPSPIMQDQWTPFNPPADLLHDPVPSTGGGPVTAFPTKATGSISSVPGSVSLDLS